MNIRVAVPYRRSDKLGPYVDAARAVGLQPVPIHVEEPAPANGYRGLLLTGGTDVDPARYGAVADARTQEPDAARDARELALLERALEAGIPVFGICRGMQLMNVALGGTLVQHIDEHEHAELDAHPVTIEPGSRLAGILGAGAVTVNSRHHQAIERVAGGLTVTARARDGIIEAVELPGEPFVVAVQWHPEDRVGYSDADKALFRAFAEAVLG